MQRRTPYYEENSMQETPYYQRNIEHHETPSTQQSMMQGHTHEGTPQGPLPHAQEYIFLPGIETDIEPNVYPNLGPNVYQNNYSNVDPNVDPNVEPNVDPNVDPNFDPNIDPMIIPPNHDTHTRLLTDVNDTYTRLLTDINDNHTRLLTDVNDTHTRLLAAVNDTHTRLLAAVNDTPTGENTGNIRNSSLVQQDESQDEPAGLEPLLIKEVAFNDQGRTIGERGKRRHKLDEKTRASADEMRRIGACVRCSIMKKTVSFVAICLSNPN